MNALEVRGLSATVISLADGAEAHRNSLIAQSVVITEISDDFTAETAGGALKLLQEMARAVEAQRSEVKAPVLKLGKDIDAVAKGFVGPLETEINRLRLMLGTYLDEQRRKAAEAERARQEAIAKAAAEEAARKAAPAPADEFEAAMAAPSAIAFPPPLPPPVAYVPPAGIQTRNLWKYEVTDIVALHKARPDLVVLEPHGRAILAALSAATGTPNIPGLRVWQEATATSRKS